MPEREAPEDTRAKTDALSPEWLTVRRPSTRLTIIYLLGLAASVAIVHGRSVGYDLFMDDYPHLMQLREARWTLPSLVEACRLDLVAAEDAYADVWWLPDVRLRFFRPVSFAFMKAVYELSGWSPVAMHACMLLLHFGACWLVMVLLRRVGIGHGLAFGVAVLFAIHPGNLTPVQWIACVTELMVTVLLLGATLCYLRYRGFDASGRRYGQAADEPADQRPTLLWFVACCVLFALAMGCRENAVMFPFVMLAVEWFLPHRNKRRLVSSYAVLAVLLVGYLILRTVMLGGVALPPKPYVVPPGDPDFVGFLIAKVGYYLVGEFLLVPVIPLGGLPYFRARPLIFGALVLAAIVIVLIAFWLHRRRPAGWLGPAWLLGFMAPVLPAFASPHHLYLPAVGWAICVALILQSIGGAMAERASALPQWRRQLAGFSVILLVALFATMSNISGLALSTGQQIEDQVVREVLHAPSGIEDGDTVYFANLPLLAHYLKLAIEFHHDVEDIKVVPLTWSPRLLMLSTPAELRWIDDRTIELWIREDRYFAGPYGYMARQATGRPTPVSEGETVEAAHFTVEGLAADERGIYGLRFTFRKPIDRPGVKFFYSSDVRWATELTPERRPR